MPREPVAAAALVGMGGQMAFVNIHSRVYVHMYTYVQTRRGPGQAAPGKTGPAPLSPHFPLLKEQGWREDKGRAWRDGRGLLSFPPPGAEGQLRLCACVRAW